LRFKSKKELTEWVLGSPHLWLFLDYDGTLADFAPAPDDVRPDPKIIRLLFELSDNPAIRVTILSGRRLEHIRRLLPICGICLAGTYGVELLTSTGKVIQRVDYDSVRPVLEMIKPYWESVINGQKGFYLEDKGWTLALHARFADDHTANQVIEQARQVIDEKSLGSRFRVLDGHKFLEIAPLLASKRETVNYLLSEYPYSHGHILYIGDDDKDEEAFSLIHAKQGVTVKVLYPSHASRPTEADFFFNSPSETLQWLRELI
jgi:trehalose 6-phosphate phosphatase